MNSFFICVPLPPDRNESQTDSAYAGRKAIVGSEEGTRRHWRIPVITQVTTGAYGRMPAITQVNLV